MKHPALPFLLGWLLLLPLLAIAENSTREQGYTVHHNAIPTAMLTPEIAHGYNIVRSKYRGLLNVSIIRDQAGTTGESVNARVKARVSDLTGRVKDLALREIRDGNAYYYIAEFPIVDGETLTFRIEATPAGRQHPIKAEIKQQFFVD